MSEKKSYPLPITGEQFVDALVNTATRNENEKKQKGFLCMFSGGVDSTAMLHALLTNKDYEHFDVFVHHIRLSNRENRGPAEVIAARNIVQYYQTRLDTRAFDYKESAFDTSTMTEKWSPTFPYDMDVTAFVAAQVCLAKPQIKYAAMGVTKDDFTRSETDKTAELRYKAAPSIFEAALYIFSPQIPKPTLIYPLQNLTKDQLWKTLPSEVQKMTWSCRRPLWKQEVPHPCGRCEPCIKRKAGFGS